MGLLRWSLLLLLGWLLLWVQYLWERLLQMLLWTRVLLQDVDAAQYDLLVMTESLNLLDQCIEDVRRYDGDGLRVHDGLSDTRPPVRGCCGCFTLGGIAASDIDVVVVGYVVG